MDNETFQKVQEIFSKTGNSPPGTLTPAASQSPSPPVIPEGELADSPAPETEVSDVDETTLAALSPESESSSSEDASASEVDLESISAALGLDKDLLSVQDGKVHVRAKVDGEVFDKPIPDVLKGYQLEEHVTRKSQDLARQREEWERKRQEEQSQFASRVEMVNKILEGEKEAIAARYKDVPWDRLRADDPANYAALQADYFREMQQLQVKQQQAATEIQKAQQEQAQQAQQQWIKTRDAEQARLQQATGWSQEEMGRKEDQIASYLMEQRGYRSEELAYVLDHRFKLLADKARQWDDLQERVKKAKGKQSSPAPRVPAGAAPRSQSSSATTQKQRLIEKAKRTGRQADKTAAAVAILSQVK